MEDQQGQIEQVKSHRIEVNKIINTIRTYPTNRELALAITSAQMARQWMGKMLGTLNTKHPYPESTNPESPVIEPMAEDTKEMLDNYNGTRPRTAVIKELRKHCETLIDGPNGLKDMAQISVWDDDHIQAIYAMQAFVNLTQCKMWLGEELGRIRNEEQAFKNSAEAQ